MLPYAPLHHLLIDAAGGPVVMTSGNVSDEPLAYRNAEAVERLAGIADLFLLHDRDIDTRCDDSVARVIAGAPAVLRRSRGYVPRGIPAPGCFAQPVLACDSSNGIHVTRVAKDVHGQNRGCLVLDLPRHVLRVEVVGS